MLQENSRDLDPELRKELVVAAEVNDAGKMAELLFRCLDPTQDMLSESAPSWLSDPLFLGLIPPAFLKFEDDDFDSVDIVSFYSDESSILDEKELSVLIVLKEIVATAAKQGFPDEALSIANRMRVGWERGEAYEAVIHGYLLAGKLDKAFEHRLLVANPSTRLHLLCHIAATQLSVGHKDACLKTITEALHLAKSRGGSDADKSLGRISVLQVKLGDLTSAHTTLQAIGEADIRAIAWSHIAVVLAQMGYRTESKEDFANALRETKEIRYTPNRVKCLLLIIEKQAEAGDVIGAISTAGTIQRDTDRAVVLDHILDNGLPENFLGCRVCAMKGYREEFQEVTTRDRGLSHVAGVQARLGNIAEAMNTVELIRWGPLQAEALFLIGKSCADSGDFVSAREKFASAFVRWVESYSRSSSVFLGKLALEQAKVGDFEGALTTTRCHELPSVRAILFAGISTVLGHTRGWEASLAVWEEADKAVNLVNDVGLRIQILLEIALDQVSTGGKDAAQTTFLTARNLAETASNLKLLLYHAKGNYDEALLLYKRALTIREHALGPNHHEVAASLHPLGLLYHAKGRHNEALALLQRALAIYERTLGQKHPDTELCRRNLKACQKSMR